MYLFLLTYLLIYIKKHVLISTIPTATVLSTSSLCNFFLPAAPGLADAQTRWAPGRRQVGTCQDQDLHSYFPVCVSMKYIFKEVSKLATF